MEEREICKNCGASILKQTATRTGSVCKPCYNFNIRSTIGETPFGRAFDLCNKPHRFLCNKPRWLRSEDDYKYQLELDYIWKYLVSDVMSLLAEIRVGYYEKVFLDRQSADGLAFRLLDGEHFREWCLARLEQAYRKANELEIETIERKVDRATLLEKIEMVQTAVELAYEVLKNREINNENSFT